MSWFQPSCVVLAAAVLAWAGAGDARGDWHYDLARSRWVRSAPSSAPDSADTEACDNQFQRAVEALDRGDADDAERIARAWLRFYRNQRDSQAAMFLLGEARRALGDYYGAYEAYEQLLDAYAGTVLLDRVLAIETELADAFLKGRKRTAFKVLRVGAIDEGQEILERVFQRDPRGARGKAALRILADYHFRQGDFAAAEDEYQKLAENFPKDPEADQFRLLAGQAALGRFQGVRNDSLPLTDAEQRLADLRNDNPKLARKENIDQVLVGIHDRRAEQDFQTAEYYRKTDKTKSAVFYYKFIVRNYPGSPWASKAKDRLLLMGVSDPPDPPAAPQVTSLKVRVPDAPGRPEANDAPGGEVVARSADQTAAAENPLDAPLRATPAPVMLGPPDGSVIDIGLPNSDNTLSPETPGGAERPPSSQPEGGDVKPGPQSP